MATYEKTCQGTIKVHENGNREQRYFKFEVDDIGKFIVIKFHYQENMFYGSLLGTRLNINGHTPEEIYGVYKIEWHSDWCEYEKNVKYKIKLTPVEGWCAWCPNRSWYTSDIESYINSEYNLFEETFLFDELNKANEFALKKNYELYPDNRSKFKKIIDKLFK